MRPSRLAIYFRHMQLQFEGNDVVVKCNPDGSAEYVPGSVGDRQWHEMTYYTDGLDKLSLQWNASSAGNADGGETNEAGSNYDKGISLEVIFTDKAFFFIEEWLLKSPCSMLNAIEVKIVDLVCKNQYRLFEIKADNLTYAPIDKPCEFAVRLREQDLVWHCVHKTFIWDNWQDWFKDNSAKEHPCFLTAIEPRPRILGSVRLGFLLLGETMPILTNLFNLGGDNDARRILDIDNFVPAPLVRDYIKNVCDKCGIGMDTMFDDVPGNEYKNLCLFYPLSGDEFWHTNEGGNILSPALWFYFENRWLVTLADFLDYLKKVFKAEWYVTPNSKLIFHPQIVFDTSAAIIDFSAPGALPIFDLEYTFDGTKKPAYGRYQYQPDGADMASQEISTLYNDIADYDGPANNPMLEGNVSNNFEFAPTGFVRDGRSPDYLRTLINDAETISYILLGILEVIALASLLSVHPVMAGLITGYIIVWVAGIAHRSNLWRDRFGEWDSEYTGAVRLTIEQVGTPRLLLWDGVSKDRAKVVRQGVPDPNAFYNPTLIPYTDRNTINDQKILFNYPLYFDSFYKENMFDRFHDKVDNPLKSLETHQSFSLRVDLCCEVMDIFGLWDGDFARIGYIIKIEQRDNHGIFGKITAIELAYEGDAVVIKGRVMKRLN